MKFSEGFYEKVFQSLGASCLDMCMWGGGANAPSSAYGVGTNYPAYYVNWYDVIVYCNLKSKADGLTPCYKMKISSAYKTFPDEWTGIVKQGEGANAKYCGPADADDNWNAIEFDTNANGWRLPTEAEWEMLARGGGWNYIANFCSVAFRDCISPSDRRGDFGFRAWFATRQATSRSYCCLQDRKRYCGRFRRVLANAA